MELKKKIGQLLVTGYQGTSPSDEYLRFVEEWGVGGIIFFTRNIQDPGEIKGIVKSFDKASGQHVFTSIDQEGGLVLRILKGGSLFPGAMALAATEDTDLVRRVSKGIALEMRALGLNWNLAPVLDINHQDNPGIGARSFGHTPQDVAKYGSEAIKGFQEGGILACAKHFPGKGHARVDSHLSLPVIPYDRERLFSFELFPFTQAIKAGVDAVMTSHVYFPAFESTPNLPGTLSKAVLTDLLRKEMKFGGLLITDDLEMGAITEAYGVPDAAKRSFLAGADLLLICHDMQKQREAAERILDAVKNSKEAAIRLEESLERIDAARKKISGKQPSASLKKLSEQHIPLISEAYQKSIRCFRAAKNGVPFGKTGTKLIICPEVSALVQVEETQQGEGITQMVREFYPDANYLVYHPKAETAAISAAINKEIKNFDSTPEILVFTYNAHLFPGQAEAFKALAKKNPGMALVAIRNPYDVNVIADAGSAFATFGFRSPAIKAVMEVISGKRKLAVDPWEMSSQSLT